MTEAELNAKFKSTPLVQLLRKCCNRNITKEEEIKKASLLILAKNLKIREHEADAWINHGTRIERFWDDGDGDQEGSDDEDVKSENEDAAEDEDEVMDEVLDEDDNTAENQDFGASEDEEDIPTAQHYEAVYFPQPDSNDQGFEHQDIAQTAGSLLASTLFLKTERPEEEWKSLIEELTREWMVKKAELIKSGVNVTTENEPDFVEYRFLMEICMEAERQKGGEAKRVGS